MIHRCTHHMKTYATTLASRRLPWFVKSRSGDVSGKTLTNFQQPLLEPAGLWLRRWSCGRPLQKWFSNKQHAPLRKGLMKLERSTSSNPSVQTLWSSSIRSTRYAIESHSLLTRGSMQTETHCMSSSKKSARRWASSSWNEGIWFMSMSAHSTYGKLLAEHGPDKIGFLKYQAHEEHLSPSSEQSVSSQALCTSRYFTAPTTWRPSKTLRSTCWEKSAIKLPCILIISLSTTPR
jgi:hypothetical protein